MNKKDINKNAESDIQEHILRLARMMRRHTAGDQPVSRSSVQLLRIALMEDGIPATELARRLDIRPSSLTDLLKRLEESGEIIRKRDAQDSRILRVHATDKAKTAFAQRQAQRQAQAERLRACLSEAECAAFCATCDKLRAFLEAEQGPEACQNGHVCHHGCGRGKESGLSGAPDGEGRGL